MQKEALLGEVGENGVRFQPGSGDYPNYLISQASQCLSSGKWTF